MTYEFLRGSGRPANTHQSRLSSRALILSENCFGQNQAWHERSRLRPPQTRSQSYGLTSRAWARKESFI